MSVRGVATAVVTIAAALGIVAGAQGGSAAPPVRVTVFGDSAATAMAYDPDAKRTLGRGIDLRLEVAACRRLGDTSCPYDGVRPPTVIERAATLGTEIGPVVVVIVGAATGGLVARTRRTCGADASDPVTRLNGD